MRSRLRGGRRSHLSTTGVFRSSVSTALWETLRVPQPGDTDLHFEHEVAVQRGRGKSSFTDLTILADDVAVAIEAKFTEPRNESVATWLGGAPTTNRVDVLEGWLCAIEAAAEASIQHDAVRDLPYQLIHRTASVCCVGRRKRLVVYQVFGDSRRTTTPKISGVTRESRGRGRRARLDLPTPVAPRPRDVWHVCWTDAEIRCALHVARVDLCRRFDGLDVRPRAPGGKRGTDAQYFTKKR